MIEECQFQYADGRNCRRIPKRGEIYCRDHRRWSNPLRRAAVRPSPSAAAAPIHPAAPLYPAPHERRAGTCALPALPGLPLDGLVSDILGSLLALEPLVRTSASSMETHRYHRACVAAAYAGERIAGQRVMLRRALPDMPAPRRDLLVRLLMFAGPES